MLKRGYVESQGRCLMRNLTFLLFLVCCFSSAKAKVTSYLTGNPEDVNPPLYGPVLNIGGGGTDVDPAIQWMINKVRGCDNCNVKVDVVVLRTSGGNGYNAPNICHEWGRLCRDLGYNQ
jgi:hypothetical protein